MAKKSSVINVAVLGDAKKLKKTLDGAEKRVGKFSDKVGKSMKVAGAAIGALGVAGAAAVLKLGSEFEKVERTLRVGTGATGDALEALVASTRNLAKKVPADFESISNAVADINTRLGLTGTELEDFSEQMLNLSRITGSDLKGNISSVTRVLGDWGDMAGTAGGAADFLFSVAQSTGIEFASLSNQLVNYGAPLRQIGFDFEQSALLIGKFEKEGVNAELVLGSLRQALGKMAREGEPAIETFQRTTEAIKNAGTASEANMLALDLFGARAGPDMAAAIREGRFELDDYFDLMEGGGDRINVAAKSTETLQEKFTLLKNRLVVALAPAITKAFDVIVQAMDAIGPIAEDVVRWFKDFTASDRFRRFQAFMETTMGEVRIIIGQVSERLREFADFFKTYISPIIEAQVKAIMVVFRSLWDVIKDVVGLIQAIFRGDMAAAWEHFKDLVVNVVGLIIDLFVKLPMNILNAAKPLIGKFALIVADFAVHLVGKIISLIAAMPGKIVELLAVIGKDVLQAGKDLGGWIIDGIVKAIRGAAGALWDALKSIIPSVGDLFGDLLGGLNPFGGSKKSSRRTNRQVNPEGDRRGAPGLGGGIASQLDLARGSLDWFQNPETIQWFRSHGALSQFQQFSGTGDVAGMEAFVASGGSSGTGANIVVNVAGSVTSEGDLVENIRQGLLKSQQSGNQLVLN